MDRMYKKYLFLALPVLLIGIMLLMPVVSAITILNDNQTSTDDYNTLRADGYDTAAQIKTFTNDRILSIAFYIVGSGLTTGHVTFGVWNYTTNALIWSHDYSYDLIPTGAYSWVNYTLAPGDSLVLNGQWALGIQYNYGGVSSGYVSFKNYYEDVKAGEFMREREDGVWGSTFGDLCYKLMYDDNYVAGPSTYYVSTSGNDANIGLSTTTAWRTITHAAASVIAGDTVYIQAGNYGAEHVVFAHSGTDGNPITFIGCDNAWSVVPEPSYYDLSTILAAPTLSATAMPLLTGTGSGDGMDFSSQSYLDIRNIQVTNYVQGAYGDAPGNITVNNLIVTTCTKDIYLRDPNYCTVKNCNTDKVTSECISLFGARDCLVENCQAHSSLGTYCYFITVGGYLRTCYDNTVRHCYLDNVGSALGGHGFTLKSGDTPPGTNNFDTYNNLIEDSVARNVDEGFCVRHSGVHDNIFRDCEAFGGSAGLEGIAIRDGAHDNVFDAIRVDGTNGSTYGAFFDDSGEEAIPVVSGQDNIIQNCIFIKCSPITIYFRAGDTNVPALNNIFTNCVFNGTGTTILVRHYSTGNNGNVIQNSIITNYGTLQDYIVSGSGSVTFTYSDFYGNGFSMPAGTGNIATNPLFVSSTNYHLQITSNCINAGTSTNAPSTDFSGAARPKGALYDIGAYEYLAPIITSGAPGTSVNVNDAYYYNGTVDQTGTWTIVTSHSWMSVDSATGKITGTPNSGDIGTHTVSLRLVNGNGTAYLNWSLRVAATSLYVCGAISVSGTHITIDGINQADTFFGVNDPTVLPFAIEAYVNGHTSYWGDNQVFPRPTTSTYQAKIPDVNNISMLWYSYFWLCNYYGVQIVRLGAGETQSGISWSTAILYNAWHNHQTAFYAVLDEMTRWADNFGVYVILDLAGASVPAYGFGAAGNPLAPGDPAYNNMLVYEKSTIQHFNASAHTNAIFSFDVFNEPDANILNTWYWYYWQALFHIWAVDVKNALTPQTAHIVEMGVGGYDNLFGFTQSSFNQVTGTVGFDVCDYHYYASANTSNSFAWPEGWASAQSKPLIYSELAYNGHYPLTRWTYAENQIASYHTGAYISMVLTGTPGYPYTGSYPDYPVPTIPPTWKPTFTSNPILTATSGTLWSYTVTTNESCTLSLISPPGFITSYIVSGHTVIRGTPADSDVGNHVIVLRAVSVRGGGTTYQNITLVVSSAYVPEPIIPNVDTLQLGEITNLVGLLLLFIAPTGMALSIRHDNPKHVVLWILLLVIILGYFAWSAGAI